MKFKEYKYVKLSYLIKYIFVAIFIIRELYLNIFLGKAMNELIIILTIYSVIIFFIFKGIGIEKMIIVRELKRRTDKLPVAKEYIFEWVSKDGIGIFFVDPEKGTFWFCSDQTNYDLYVYPIIEFNIYENNTTLFFEKKLKDSDLKKFKVFKVT